MQYLNLICKLNFFNRRGNSMKKSLIALAVAAALPVAVQADATLSGSVTVKMSENSKVDTDASLKIAIEEQLANGMTAKADFEVMAADGNRGTASLSGDFGSLTAGTIDSDAAFQAGDVADLVTNTVDADEVDTEVQGFHIATNMTDMQMQLQRNARTTADGITTTNIMNGTQLGLIYDLNGLSIGAAYASADADGAYTTGVNAATTVYGVSYSFGDLTFQAGKQENLKAQSRATYKTTMDAFALEATIEGGNTRSHKVIGTYTASAGLAITATAEKDKKMTYGATYTSGDLTFDATVDRNDKDKLSAALDMGNADLTLEVEQSNTTTSKVTSLTYKVAF
jgi:hypothetical protein